MRVQVVAEAGHEVEIERGGRHDGDEDRDEEEEVVAERLDVLEWREKENAASYVVVVVFEF